MRSRNIKPGFYKNADLLECEPLARILFSGLWCLADREGRLIDRAKQIKVEILPCDNCDVDALLNQLAKCNLIQRYEVDGERYIQVYNFMKHQKPHIKEVASTIPAPTQHLPRQVQATTQEVASPADSLLLIPDSLIPDSLTPHTAKSDAQALLTFVLPDWIDQSLWDDFMEIRRAKKAKNSIRAKELLVRKLTEFKAKGHDPTAIIEKSITSSWTDVFEPKENYATVIRNSQRNDSQNASATGKSTHGGKSKWETAAAGVIDKIDRGEL